MRVLGISSATKIVSLGLVDGARVLAETTLTDNRAEKVMFYVKNAGIEPQQLEAVAVAQGPGSYSGLRGGLATAKSIAQALNIPLAGISTLEAIAYNLVELEGTVAVILDARLDEYNFALFGAAGGKLKRLTGDLVLKLDVIRDRLASVSGDLWVAGNLSEIRELERENLHFADEVHSQPYGINVARLGEIMIKSGQAGDPLTMAPRYSHLPPIREFKGEKK